MTFYPETRTSLTDKSGPMFFSASYSRYSAELVLYSLFAGLGIFLNSQTLVALGILVLSHCLPSLVLAMLRSAVPDVKDSTTTLYSNNICSFREKETVMLISSSLIIGFSIGILFLSLQKFSLIPLVHTEILLLIGAAYIMIEAFLYSAANIKSKLNHEDVKKPLPSRIFRIVVASLMIAIAMIEHQWLQSSLDLFIGLAVLSYVTYNSLISLIDVAKKNFNYSPRGIDVEDVRAFILDLPGVQKVNKVYFRRVNEVEHELGVRLSLAPYILNNTIELTNKIKDQITAAYGISNVTIELVQPELDTKQKESTDYSVIVLGYDNAK